MFKQVKEAFPAWEWEEHQGTDNYEVGAKLRDKPIYSLDLEEVAPFTYYCYLWWNLSYIESAIADMPELAVRLAIISSARASHDLGQARFLIRSMVHD